MGWEGGGGMERWLLGVALVWAIGGLGIGALLCLVDRSDEM